MCFKINDFTELWVSLSNSTYKQLLIYSEIYATNTKIAIDVLLNIPDTSNCVLIQDLDWCDDHCRLVCLAYLQR